MTARIHARSDINGCDVESLVRPPFMQREPRLLSKAESNRYAAGGLIAAVLLVAGVTGVHLSTASPQPQPTPVNPIPAADQLNAAGPTQLDSPAPDQLDTPAAPPYDSFQPPKLDTTPALPTPRTTVSRPRHVPASRPRHALATPVGSSRHLREDRDRKSVV